ncbi:MAG: transcription termination/antitermination protein NusA [Candidatus Magasanikbacteria bacterium]|nr:transcription termination/antitermination protein NusA [Candidatus Magasanikbacteria bacterium]
MSEITKAIQALCDEKGIAYETVMETVESALAAAYRKDFGNKQQNIKVKFDPETGDMQAWDIKTVVADIPEEALEKAQEELATRREKAREEGRELTEEETADLPRFNPKLEMMLTPAREIKSDAQIGEVLEMELKIPHEFGRMAAQTAKQVIIQKIREAERGLVFDDFKNHEGQLIVGTVQRAEARKVLVDLGKITGIMPGEEQVESERYRPGARLKFYVVSVTMTVRGPEIILSRRHAGMVREIFRQEIPEIGGGKVEVKGIAREAGWRSKVAVAATDSAIDPIGSCIGQRGSRINTIIDQLGGEKIDIIQYSDNPADFISHALSPAKVFRVELDSGAQTAVVTVAPDQYSLAIGRSGQNVRLASELTGWRLNVRQEGGGEPLPEAAAGAAAPAAETDQAAEAVPAAEEAGELTNDQTPTPSAE